MRISTIFLLLFSALSPLLLYAWTEPTAPPPEERQYIGHLEIIPEIASSVSWSYPADGLFTWVATTTTKRTPVTVSLYCNSSVDNKDKYHMISATPYSGYLTPEDIIRQDNGSMDPMIVEYKKFNNKGILPIGQWIFTGSLDRDYMYSDHIIFYCYDDINQSKRDKDFMITLR